MQITILTYVEAEAARDYDVVVSQVAAALKRRKHAVRIVGVHADAKKLVATLLRNPPDLVFHLCECFAADIHGDIAVAGVLELLGLPFTGCSAGELFLAQDKAVSKKLLAFENIGFPRFAVFARNAGFETGGNLRMPLFVKPLRADASIGIEGRNLVHDTATLMKRIAHIHQTCEDDALVEEYIDGREFYVGVLGNDSPIALPPIEMDFSAMPQGMPHILDAKAKFQEASAEYKGTKAVVAEIPDTLRARLQQVSLDAYRALKVRDYGRVDLRLSATGEIYVIEVNAGCYLEESGEFATAAKAHGLSYDEVIDSIARGALARRGSRRVAPVANVSHG